MPKKTDKLFDKIVKKDYNNELEKVLEKKYFNENVKSILLSILYKIETAYKDYETVKPGVETKEEFIENMINGIQKNCDDIKVVRLNSSESSILGTRTFLVQKEKKRIICYPIERKLLYCLAKIDKQDKIIKDHYYVIDRTLSDLINVGNNIDTVEPMRDFNGYSWTTIPREIESTSHNLVYQNIRILVGSKFLKKWIQNNEFIIDYMESFQNHLESSYGVDLKEQVAELINKISVLLAGRYNNELKKELMKEKKVIEAKLSEIKDNKQFVQEMTQEKRKLTKDIKHIDETINNKNLLQAEYEKRNEELMLEEKIFSIRILSKMMLEERETKMKRLDELNILLNPRKFIKYKEQLTKRNKYLKLLNSKNLDKDIRENIIELQKIFLQCYLSKVEKVENKQELMNIIYEFRYYCQIPFDQEQFVGSMQEMQASLQEVEKEIIKKAQELKVIDGFCEDIEVNYQILKNIFYVRIINLEDIYIKLTKDKANYYIQLFDENAFEEKIELENMEDLKKTGLTLKLNKKVKVFN